ncbi:hypothetical protein [Mesorhizobium sp. M0088]|uniref:hypothetical protein n=1 Tax=Mesorhizobium sp. M0088 TaxID=2956873 RepID=UPI00333AEEAF
MTEAEILELYRKHRKKIKQALRSIPPMPVFGPDGSFEGIRHNYVIMLTGALLASGVPVGDAKQLAVDIGMAAGSRVRENLGREAGHG